MLLLVIFAALAVVLLFRHGNGFIIALTYGRKSEWVQHVMAANGCELDTNLRKLKTGEPRILHDEQRKSVPRFVKSFLGILNVSDLNSGFPRVRRHSDVCLNDRSQRESGTAARDLKDRRKLPKSAANQYRMQRCECTTMAY
jgi:hypothetical protein